MSDSQKGNDDQDYISTNLFDTMPLFEQNNKTQSYIILNNSLSKITNLFSFISNKLLELKSNKEEKKLDFFQNFEDLKKNQIDFLNNSIDIRDLNYVYIMKLINSQIILYDFINEIFLEKYIKAKYNDIYNISRSLSENIFSNYNILFDIIFKLSEKLEELSEEINQLNNNIKNKEKYIKQFSDNNNLLNEKLNKKHIENKYTTKTIIVSNQNNPIISNSYYLNNKYTVNALKSKIYNNFININNNSKLSNKKSISNRNSNNILLNDTIQQNLNVTNLYLTGFRKFTPKMFKDLIYNIYEAKESFNKKCIENKKPKETLEQFIYTFFNYKYGLKNMVIEWATNIINGIKNYSLIDSEICLFGKIMRNELDESCHMIMPKLKKDINDSFMSILKKEYSFKNEDEIIEHKNKLIKKRLPLNIVQLILDNLYSQKEKEKIIPKINISINEYKNKYNISKNKNYLNNNNTLYNLNCKNNKDSKYHNKLTRIEMNQKIIEKENELNTLDYNDLLDIFHEYQMNKREEYLMPFVNIFKSIDEDSDGILTEKQFINLVKALNIFDNKNFEKEVEKLLNNIDPYRNNQIIFTDCVNLFSFNNGDGESVLDKIYKNKINFKDNEKIEETKSNIGDNMINENLDDLNFTSSKSSQN